MQSLEDFRSLDSAVDGFINHGSSTLGLVITKLSTSLFTQTLTIVSNVTYIFMPLHACCFSVVIACWMKLFITKELDQWGDCYLYEFFMALYYIIKTIENDIIKNWL